MIKNKTPKFKAGDVIKVGLDWEFYTLVKSAGPRRGWYGWIMIGASTDTDALSQAQLSTSYLVTPDRLERWNGQHYIGVLS